MATRVRNLLLRRSMPSVARAVSDERLTYLSDSKLANLGTTVTSLNRDSVVGGFVECGVALGGSGIVLAVLMDEANTGGRASTATTSSA